MIRSKGYHSGSRSWLTLSAEERKRNITRLFLQKFNKGDKVIIYPEPRYQRNIPHTRFFGKVGVVEGMRGRAYEIVVKDGKKLKKLQLYPWHLRKLS
ncbi:MAG: 50S ribosomal protein L21e [Candidatus Rehaiarchaeum fermentans]|nr:50S ribosomal protein L21e [Candidatus Rehaiarchaeum fermentans]